MGNNAYGQIGRQGETKVEYPSPVLASDGNRIGSIVNVSCGDYSTYLRTRTKEIYAIGKNNNGSLGLGEVANISVPTKLTFSDAELISTGLNNIFAVQNDGTVYSCGANDKGQLGLNDKTDRNILTKIGGEKLEVTPNVITIEVNDSFDITASLNNIFNLRTDVIRDTGFNYDSLDKNTVSVTEGEVTGTKQGLTTVVVKDQESGYTANIYVEVIEKGYKSIPQIFSGKDFVISVRYDGTLWGWGVNDVGQLGDGTFENRTEPVQIPGLTKRVTQISAANGHILVLTEDGYVLGAGLNQNGQCGMGSNISQNSLQYVVDENGEKIENIVRVSAIPYKSYVLDKDGNVYLFGINSYKVGTKLERNRKSS